MEDNEGGIETQSLISNLYITFRHSPEQIQMHPKNNIIINNNSLEY